MIYTCTMNPSLDYFMKFEGPLHHGSHNRSLGEYYAAGGKGINISIMLSNLGIPSRALGFLGGFSKDLYISLLNKYEMLQPNFSYIDGNTRINVKIRDVEDTTLNAAGPTIAEADMNKLRRKIDNLAEGDYLCMAGNCQSYLQESISEILNAAIGEGVRVVLYTNVQIHHDVVPNKPFLMKMTAHDLSVYYGRPINNDDEAIEAAKQMHADGAENVLLVLENYSGAVLVCNKGVFSGKIMRDEPLINTVGIGDSLVAGFLMHYNRSSNPEESMRYALACGSATAYTNGFGEKDTIMSFYETAEVARED